MGFRILLILLLATFSQSTLFSQSGVDIEVLTPDVCVPGKVTVRVINCSSCVAYEWEVKAGTGFKSAGYEYSTIISDTGWLDVAVKLKTSAGAILLLGKKKAVYGRRSPKPQFTIDKPVVCHGADSLTLNDLTPQIKTRDWLIDGKVYYNGPAQLKIPAPTGVGYKSVYLLVRDSWDCKGTLLKDSAIAVWDSLRIAMQASRYTGCAPANINYTFTADTFQQRIKQVTWTFEKGTPATSTSRSPKNIYYSKGDTLDAALSITTDKGCVYKLSKNNFLQFGDTALMSISLNKTKYCASDQVVATVSNALSPNPLWQIKNLIINADSLNGPKIKFYFRDTGAPVITVSDNNNGCISTATYNQKITVEGPVASFAAETPFYCSLPKTLVFTNSSTEYAGGTSWSWKMWNGSGSLVASATTKNLSYNTSTGSNYSVYLKATGSNGCVDSAYLSPASTFGHIDTAVKFKPNPACPGRTIDFEPSAGPGSKTVPNQYLWTFYDLNGKVIKTDNKVTPQLSYPKPGLYSFKMKVYNQDGCKDSVFLKDTIRVQVPEIDFYFPDSLVCVNEAFKIAARYRLPKGMIRAFWYFNNLDSGKGSTFVETDSAMVRLSYTGRYSISYTIIDTSGKGCSYSYPFPFRVKVSGISLSAASDKSFGCSPLSVNLSSKLNYYVDYTGSGNGITYKWSSDKPAETVISSPTAANTPATANTKYNHRFKLIYTGQNGCRDSVSTVVNTEFGAGFSIPGNLHCVGDTGLIHDLSTVWSDSVRYKAGPGVVFMPTANKKQPRIVFTRPGTFAIWQYAYSGGCKDSTLNYFDIYKVTADFYSPDSVTYCAPRLINFFNNTPGAIYNYWKFGDGDTAKTLFNDLAGHLYLKNNSHPGYDVQLIAVNQYGCRDTLLKKNYVRLIGPIPDFSLFNIKGCEPLPVTFKNNSRDYNRMFVDYDNGTVVDSTVLGTYKYRVTDKALPVQVFKPKLLLYDSFGCSALAYASDSITVLKSAEALHSFSSVNFLRGTEGCTNNLLVKFVNKSRFYIKTYWDFNDDGKIDIQNQNNPSFLYDKPGVFKPVIIAENINGCRDTFRRDSIIVWQHPIADFKSSADTTCAIDPVTFWSTTKFANPVKTYAWNFGELPIYTDTSSASSAVWKYTTPFGHAVKFDVEDVKGCKDQLIRNIYVNDTAGPLPPELALITVRNDQYVDLYWRRSKLGNFLQYHVMLDSLGLTERYKSYNRSDTFFSYKYGSEVNNRRFCYTAMIEDTCNQKGIVAVSHCTIVLRDTAFEPFNIRLDWLAYDWWGSDLSHYEVFRKDPGSSVFNKIADVKSNRLSFTDSFLCDKTYCYYVEAVHKNREYRSRSNSVCRKPIYVSPDSSVNTTLVTVRDNSYIESTWQPYYRYYRNFDYVLERSSNGLPGSFSQAVVTKNLSASDFAADVHSRINYYRVRFRDHCGVESAPGIVSNSIWLQFRSQARTSTQLQWNPYNYWHAGVQSYGVQVKERDGSFRTFRMLPSTARNLDSINIEAFDLDSICFRVFAVKDSVVTDTSWSNELCLVPASYVHVPNSFTPDGNNLNETFRPVSGFIHRNTDDPNDRYEFRVYNRWGQLIFETFEPEKGWNGQFGGKNSPSGLYIWTVKALGYDGVPHRMEGTVYLMR